MLVDNNTTHCFVLAAGVIIEPSASGVVVSDDRYQTDSTLNEQIDSLDDGGFIEVTDKPSDPFPTGNVIETPALVAGTDPTTAPLTVTAAEGQFDDGNDIFVIQAEDGGGQGGFKILQVDPYSSMLLRGLPGNNAPYFALQTFVDNVVSPHIFLSANQGIFVQPMLDSTALEVDGAPNATASTVSIRAGGQQTGRVLEMLDANGALCFAINADGTIHAKTGGSIHFDL